MRLQTGALRTLWGVNFLLSISVFLAVFAAIGLIPRAGTAGPSPPEPAVLPDPPERAPLDSYSSIWTVPPRQRPPPPPPAAEPPLESLVALRGVTLGPAPDEGEVCLEKKNIRGAPQVSVQVGESVSLGGLTITLRRVFRDAVTGRTTAVFVTRGGTESQLVSR